MTAAATMARGWDGGGHNNTVIKILYCLVLANFIHRCCSSGGFWGSSISASSAMKADMKTMFFFVHNSVFILFLALLEFSLIVWNKLLRFSLICLPMISLHWELKRGKINYTMRTFASSRAINFTKMRHHKYKIQSFRLVRSSASEDVGMSYLFPNFVMEFYVNLLHVWKLTKTFYDPEVLI